MMAVHDHAAVGSPLLGFLTDETGGFLHVAVIDGHWRVPASATVRPWANPTWAGTGRAVEVSVPAGTEVQFTKSFAVQPLDTPFTLTDCAVEAIGADKVADLGASWRVVALDDEVVLPPSGTFSYEMTWCPGRDTACDGHAVDSVD